MQSLRLHKSGLQKEVLVPPSKSYANRALILAAIIDESPILKNLPQASDVEFLIDALSSIGLNVEIKKNQLDITNTFPTCELSSPREISVGEGGTTARFLASLLLLGKSKYTLILGNRLKERPWSEFIELVRTLGAKADLKDNKLSLQGPINLPDQLEVDCSKTTQFATAFQLLFPYTNSKIIPKNLTSSKSYWDMTEKMVQEFSELNEYVIPADFSSASYPLAFAAINQEIFFPYLKADPYQADSKFLDVLHSLGCLEYKPDGIIVRPVKIHRSIKLSVQDCLDLVPSLGYFLAHIEGEHELTGVENLVYKESDRLNEVIKLVEVFGRTASTDGHSIFIKGEVNRISSTVDLQMPDDHRMVMAGALFLLHHGGGTITPSEAVSKSYPDFFKLISY